MAKVNFTFTLYIKYWPIDKKDPVLLKSTIEQVLTDALITWTNITVSTQLDTAGQIKQADISVVGASSVKTDLDHAYVAGLLGLNP